jgi:hypothetical protein
MVPKLILERKRLPPLRSFVISRRESKNWREARLIKVNNKIMIKVALQSKTSMSMALTGLMSSQKMSAKRLSVEIQPIIKISLLRKVKIIRPLRAVTKTRRMRKLVLRINQRLRPTRRLKRALITVKLVLLRRLTKVHLTKKLEVQKIKPPHKRAQMEPPMSRITLMV